GMSGKVWDRWTQRECDMQSVSYGYGCNYDNAKAQDIKAANDAAEKRIEKARAASEKVANFVSELHDKSGVDAIRTLRAAGFAEKEIFDWVTGLRQKMLNAGAPKNLVDDYFGGDPYEPDGERS